MRVAQWVLVPALALLVAAADAQVPPQQIPFHCDVFCGSGHEEMAGEIVVMP